MLLFLIIIKYILKVLRLSITTQFFVFVMSPARYYLKNVFPKLAQPGWHAVVIDTVLRYLWIYNDIVPDFQYIRSKKGKQLILYKDYSYSFNKYSSTKKTTYWVCSSRSAKNCKATLFVNEHDIIIIWLSEPHSSTTQLLQEWWPILQNLKHRRPYDDYSVNKY